MTRPGSVPFRIRTLVGVIVATSLLGTFGLSAIVYPPFAYVPALVLGSCLVARWAELRTTRARLLVAVPLLVWCAYGLYEARVAVWAQDVIAPIRVDLLLIIPIAYPALLLAIWVLIEPERFR